MNVRDEAQLIYALVGEHIKEEIVWLNHLLKKAGKYVIIAVLSLSGLCLLLVAISAISNLGLPQGSPEVETLSQADKVRLAEAVHLRQAVGDTVWPGWGQADIPVIVYDEFLRILDRLSQSRRRAGSKCRQASNAAANGRECQTTRIMGRPIIARLCLTLTLPRSLHRTGRAVAG